MDGSGKDGNQRGNLGLSWDLRLPSHRQSALPLVSFETQQSSAPKYVTTGCRIKGKYVALLGSGLDSESAEVP